ncbi:hypothetical protein Smp_147480 [Schistosoma mansoni]|uniref:hypothetical protein n=1 Tax=Schistosoma mansoni TaxID=6183 RepID=UPI0001A63EFD|nr:hypothetical protein Smp_147480 [Schistosoma mansoni]|eukprot:XP_018654735.1 hypothetical protein Smp_147480 [Schistosoma mansoni]
MFHNHLCSSSWMVFDPWTRRLFSKDKENWKPVMLTSPSIDKVIKSINEQTGKQITAADVKTMKAYISIGCGTQMQAFSMLRQNGELREYPENGYVTRICFSNHGQMELYHKYPEVVGIDYTYSANNEK